MLYQVNTRVILGEIGPRATLDDLPDNFLDNLASKGIAIVWMLGVWQTGPAGRAVSRTRPDWLAGYREVLPDLREEDVTGSPFAVCGYQVHRDFGGDAALARLRQRLNQRGLRLMLDFVPNHVALDHPWVRTHPEWLIHGTPDDLIHEPGNWVRLGERILAHGRDPYFPGWPDTLQLNWFHPGLRTTMGEELVRLADVCDGVRCDMAMLLLPDVFQRTWGEKARPVDDSRPERSDFWPGAIRTVKARRKEFLFLAEVYWDLEWTLQQQGFDSTYDKRLYDRLHAGNTAEVRGHLRAELDYQNRCARFLENHDEPRAAATFAPARHRAAAVVTYLTPGLRFFHDGQWEGRKVPVSNHLGRRPVEGVDRGVEAFYERLLTCLKQPEVREGSWRLCECRRAWDDNPTGENFLAWVWRTSDGRMVLVTVNHGPTRGQCFVSLDDLGLEGHSWELRDLLSEAHYERDGDGLGRRGLYLDLPEWGCHAFRMEARR